MNDSFRPSFNRRSMRLKGYDYSQDGANFIKIVTQKRAWLFGSIIDGEMVLNEAGRMIDQVCHELPEFIHNMDWVIYQIMPNHFHAIIELKNVGADLCVCLAQHSLSWATTEGCPYG